MDLSLAFELDTMALHGVRRTLEPDPTGLRTFLQGLDHRFSGD